METLYLPTYGAHYSTRRMTKPVNFRCHAAGAETVVLMGDFNDWRRPDTHLMQRQTDGTWFLQVPLPHGHHRYRFLVDGQPMLDPQASGATCDDFGERCSLRAVS